MEEMLCTPMQFFVPLLKSRTPPKLRVCDLRAANRELWQKLLLGLLQTPVFVPLAWLRYMPSAKFTFADN